MWDWLAANVAVGRPFTWEDIKIGATPGNISASLSWLRCRHQCIRVVDKKRSTYVYEMVSLEPPVKFRGPNPAKRKSGLHRTKGGRLKWADIHGVDLLDFTGIEQRVAAYYINTLTLENFTTSELLTELLRRDQLNRRLA